MPAGTAAPPARRPRRLRVSLRVHGGAGRCAGPCSGQHCFASLAEVLQQATATSAAATRAGNWCLAQQAFQPRLPAQIDFAARCVSADPLASRHPNQPGQRGQWARGRLGVAKILIGGNIKDSVRKNISDEYKTRQSFVCRVHIIIILNRGRRTISRINVWPCFVHLINFML